MERYSLTGALRLEALGQGVLPHEDTAEGPKRDRLALMEACEANFSPIMGLYRDDAGQVETVRNRAMGSPPEVELAGDDGQVYTVWRITEAASLETLQGVLGSQPVYLADGHHRYETALVYRDRARSRDPGPEPAADFVMTSLIAFDDPGLLVLPYHRVVGGLATEQLHELQERARQLFTVQPASVDLRNAGPLEELVAQEGGVHPAMGFLGPQGEGPYLLSLASALSVLSSEAGRGPLSGGPAEALREVEAWLLQERLLRPVLGEGFADHVTYVPDAQQALDSVASGQGQMAFILPALRLDLFQRVVGAGARLPRKSTYFHPKLLTGLVINPLEGSL